MGPAAETDMDEMVADVQRYDAYQDILDFAVVDWWCQTEGLHLMHAAPRKFEISWLTSLSPWRR
jgi:hypothetical protein